MTSSSPQGGTWPEDSGRGGESRHVRIRAVSPGLACGPATVPVPWSLGSVMDHNTESVPETSPKLRGRGHAAFSALDEDLPRRAPRAKVARTPLPEARSAADTWKTHEDRPAAIEPRLA